jgi:hypothetical protein
MERAPRALAALMVVAQLAPAIARADDQSEAKALFSRGVDAYGRGKYDAALEAFKASYRLRAVPVVLFNIAETYVALDAFDDAMTYLGLLEASTPVDSVDSAQRDQVAQLRERIKRASGTLRVIAPEGATVVVDGRDGGVAALRPVFLPAGQHTLSVSHPDFAPMQQRVRVAAGEAALVDAKLPPKPRDANVRVVVRPDATVLVDGRTPQSQRRDGSAVVFTVRPGWHELSVAKPGMTSFEAVLDFKPGDSHEVRATLLPSQPRPFTSSPAFWAGVGIVAGGLLGYALARSTQ